MTDQNQQFDMPFMQLVMSLQAAAMQQMGKVMSPLSGKIERDLPMAQSSISMLEMLERKTKGNLNEDEKSILTRFLYELRMNYVEERKKGENSEADGSVEDAQNPDSKTEETVADQENEDKTD